MAHPAEAGEVGDEELSAPQRPVGPETESVEAHGQHGRDTTVLDHARGGMGVMVLDADEWTVELDGELRREVLRVEVMGDEVGDHTVQRRQVFDRLEERGVRGDVFEVADVMAGDHVGALGHRHRVLQLRSDGEDSDGRGVERQPDRLGGIATRATQQLHSSGVRTRDRVVTADVDGAVVAEQPVGQRSQSADGVVVVVGDRLVAAVAARHHERTADALEQEVVQRAVRQHHPQLRQIWRDRLDDG